MQTYCTEAVILQSLDFQEHDRILTLFTRNEGLIKLIVKGSAAKQKSWLAPLSSAEFIYSKGKSDLYKCQEISMGNPFPSLRHSFSVLESASDMLQAILVSQFPANPAPLLYDLLLWSFNKLPLARDPYLMSVSFRLKLLRHDGLWQLNTSCSACSILASNICLSAGETFCPEHAPPNSIALTQEEALLIDLLMHYRTFSEVSQLVLMPGLREKMRTLFDELF